MPSYRDRLLTQAEPLEPHEIADLERWLEALREDIGIFGAAPEDEARMAAIADKVSQSRSSGRVGGGP